MAPVINSTEKPMVRAVALKTWSERSSAAVILRGRRRRVGLVDLGAVGEQQLRDHQPKRPLT